jgi:hypothetical protein
MPAPLIALAPAILKLVTELIDKLWPDADAADEAKLKLIELQQAGAFKDIEAWLEQARIDAEDRANARNREIATGDSWTPRLLAGGITLGFFGVLAWLLAAGAPQHGGEALLVLLGALSSGFAAVLAFYFGSSAGSARKTAALLELEHRK